jgi:alkaline phosphatase D
VNRRRFLTVCRDAIGVVALGAIETGAGQRGPRLQDSPFRLGIASGDPLPDSVVLWTKLDAHVLDRSGALPSPVPVSWEIADDEQFRRVVRQGTAVARAELGHSVHAEVNGLRPGRHYWYRFHTGGEISTTGRTRTAPAANDDVQRLRFAVASCQNYENGYYAAYRGLVADDPDVVVFLGDYIYETGTMGVERAVRLQESTGEAVSLDEYRARYAHYKLDADLQAAHAACPWIVTSDDHEVKNDYAGAEAPGAAQVSAQQFLLRRAAAYQAYYEFMPMRRTSMPEGPSMRLFRRLRFGRLAEFHVLDTRQYRSGLVCGGGRKIRCEEAVDSNAEMLGPEQEKWLASGLRRSSARWNLLANQVLICDNAQLADNARAFSMDNWNGHLRARTRLLTLLADTHLANPVVLTGDIHSSWVGDLKLDFDNPSSATIGTEIVGTSISSGGDGDDNPRLDVLSVNPHFKYYNNRRGYVLCNLTGSRLTSDYRTVPYVTRPDAPIGTHATFVVEDGRPGAQRVDGR